MVKKNQLYFGDNLEVLRTYIKDETVDLVYLDPPFPGKLTCCTLGCGRDNDRVLADVEARSVAA